MIAWLEYTAICFAFTYIPICYMTGGRLPWGKHAFVTVGLAAIPLVGAIMAAATTFAALKLMYRDLRHALFED